MSVDQLVILFASLLLEFTNGERGEFNCAHLLNFGVFSELKDIHYFSQARVQHGTVTWPHEQDICPDTLYCDSIKVPQASEESVPYVPIFNIFL
ncbi:MAG: DUF2442 domain-containing protein [Kiritimatiellia bacterium]